jgi:hypothetical protein
METEVTGAISDYQKLLNEDLPAFNRFLVANNVTAVLAATGTSLQDSVE